jgi:formate-dependent nitrite reductase membrane component NrfD
MLAGFKYVTAQGDVGKIQDSTRALTYAIIGAILVIGATAIAQIIKNLVNAFRS